VALMDWIKKLFSSRPSAAAAARELGRNDLCWCGSGKKYKRCHLRDDMHKRVEARYAAQFAARNSGGGIVPPGGAKKAKGGRMPEAAQPPAGK
jgi:hypothetical protein